EPTNRLQRRVGVERDHDGVDAAPALDRGRAANVEAIFASERGDVGVAETHDEHAHRSRQHVPVPLRWSLRKAPRIIAHRQGPPPPEGTGRGTARGHRPRAQAEGAATATTSPWERHTASVAAPSAADTLEGTWWIPLLPPGG